MKALVLLLATLALLALPAAGSGGTTGTDWTRYGFDAARDNVGPAVTGITAATVSQLVRKQVTLDGTVDSSPIYLHGVTVKGHTHDVFFVTTTYGKTEAIDATTGAVLWRFTPPAYSRLAGTAQVTTMAPVADPSRTAIYAGASDGRIRKLRVSDGKVLWTARVTRDPTHEKLTSSLNFSRGLVLVTTGGYIGDAPPYQGHVVSLFAGSGKIDHVWNSLCSNRTTIILPKTCAASDSAIWSRNGAAVEPGTGDLVVATGNALFNGSTNWGDSVLVLSPDAGKLLRHWTPANQATLNTSDLDVGSTSPALLPGGYGLQGGKAGVLDLLPLDKLPGVNAKTGGEVQQLPTPGGAMMFTEPAVWQGKWVFIADGSGTEALRFSGGRLHPAWSNSNGGTSPVVAGGLLYVANSGALRVYAPTTGKQLASLPYGGDHWQTPIITDGRIAIAEGNSNSHSTNGVLDIYHLP